MFFLIKWVKLFLMNRELFLYKFGNCFVIFSSCVFMIFALCLLCNRRGSFTAHWGKNDCLDPLWDNKQYNNKEISENLQQWTAAYYFGVWVSVSTTGPHIVWDTLLKDIHAFFSYYFWNVKTNNVFYAWGNETLLLKNDGNGLFFLTV